MSDPTVEYATEEEAADFVLHLWDDHIKHEVATLLVAEYAEEDGLDLSALKSKLDFGFKIHAIYDKLRELTFASCSGQPLEKTDYLKYMGAFWRTISEDNLRSGAMAKFQPEKLERVLRIRSYKQPRNTSPGRYEKLGTISRERTRRSQDSSLS